MNIQNIRLLAERLVTIGFDTNIGLRLLQQVCFQPPHFVLIERVLTGKDLLTCTLYFERIGDEYTCPYYDACFLKEIELPPVVLHDIDVLALDHRMGAIVWVPDTKSSTVFALEVEESWEREREIESVVSGLSQLSASVEGTYYADCLKLKYWAGLPLPMNPGNMQSLRARMEVNQRFYIMDGHGIGPDEAYRFLLNRWMERAWAAKKKGAANKGHDAAKSQTANSVALLPKKKGKVKK